MPLAIAGAEAEDQKSVRDKNPTTDLNLDSGFNLGR
jgi:hypothetical protein